MSSVSVNKIIIITKVYAPCQPIKKAINVKGYPEHNAPTKTK